MKKLICSLTLALITAWPLASSGQPITGSPQVSPGQPSWEKDPAYLPIDKVLDLNTIRPKVNVNLPRFLLQDAASGLTNGPDSPLAGTGIDFAELIKDVKLIRVVVIEADQTNRPALDKAVRTLQSGPRSQMDTHCQRAREQRWRLRPGRSVGRVDGGPGGAGL